MKARIKWVEGLSFVAESGSGHALVTDGSPDVGGRDLGPRPMELVLMGMGACSAIDVVLILRKARQKVVDCVCELEAQRAAEPPRVFTNVRMHYVVTGSGLDGRQVERAIRLSKDKYCSATAMIAKTAQVDFDFEIREAGAGEDIR